MVKKSKHFENLNSVKKSSAKKIILDEFIKNLNNRIEFLKNSFPKSFSRYFSGSNLTSFTDETTHSIEGKKTLVILRELFDNRKITEEVYDNEYVSSYEKGKILNLDLISTPELDIVSNPKDKYASIPVLEYAFRKERQTIRIIEMLSPETTSSFLSIKEKIFETVHSVGFLELGKYTANRNELILAKKKFLHLNGCKPEYHYIFYNDFYRFINKFIFAKGLLQIKNELGYKLHGSEQKIVLTSSSDLSYKAFLIYDLYETVIKVSFNFGKELFGSSKNPLSKKGGSISAYEDEIENEKISEKIRGSKFFNSLIYQESLPFQDEFSKTRYRSYMSRDLHSLIIPLKVLRLYFLTFGVNHSSILIGNLHEKKGLSDKDVSAFFNLVLDWCERRFNRCMKFFMDIS